MDVVIFTAGIAVVLGLMLAGLIWYENRYPEKPDEK